MQEVGGGVIGTHGRAAIRIDPHVQDVALLDGTALDPANVKVEVAQYFARVGDGNLGAARANEDTGSPT